MHAATTWDSQQDRYTRHKWHSPPKYVRRGGVRELTHELALPFTENFIQDMGNWFHWFSPSLSTHEQARWHAEPGHKCWYARIHVLSAGSSSSAKLKYPHRALTPLLFMTNAHTLRTLDFVSHTCLAQLVVFNCICNFQCHKRQHNDSTRGIKESLSF